MTGGRPDSLYPLQLRPAESRGQPFPGLLKPQLPQNPFVQWMFLQTTLPSRDHFPRGLSPPDLKPQPGSGIPSCVGSEGVSILSSQSPNKASASVCPSGSHARACCLYSQMDPPPEPPSLASSPSWDLSVFTCEVLRNAPAAGGSVSRSWQNACRRYVQWVWGGEGNGDVKKVVSVCVCTCVHHVSVLMCAFMPVCACVYCRNVCLYLHLCFLMSFFTPTPGVFISRHILVSVSGGLAAISTKPKGMEPVPSLPPEGAGQGSERLCYFECSGFTRARRGLRGGVRAALLRGESSQGRGR